MSLTRKSSYFYELPERLIAQVPLTERATSRLLHLDRQTGTISHLRFTDIIGLLRPGDVLVVNNTKVIPARLFGKKDNGGKAEVFLLNQMNETTWKALVRPGRRCPVGTHVVFSDELQGTIIAFDEQQTRQICFQWEGDFWHVLDKAGSVPLPPYIHRQPDENDTEQYQTVYAKTKGSVAAPTAGLHFTDDLFSRLRDAGVTIEEVLLHVGLGTFRPVKTENILEHEMHHEYCEITPDTAERINQAKQQGRRIITVGTTSTRTLESFAYNGMLQSGSHWTNLFIYPGKEFRIVDGMITNFHMPESTLMMLVSAFAGYEKLMNAYRVAVAEEYRFFSYGDAMFII